MKKSHGGQSGKSRNFVSKGRLPISAHLKEFKEGERARLAANPSVGKGRINKLRYNGKIVEVVGKQGKCYKVSFKDGGKEKSLIVSNVHLRKVD